MVRQPKPNAFFDEEGMMNRVRKGEIERLRRYFDLSLQGEAVYRPTWPHLKLALEQNNLPMMRLLVTWGAAPTPDDLQALADEQGDAAQAAFKKLRVAGLDLRQLPPPSRPAGSVKKNIPDVAAIPAEWKQVLAAFHNNGAPEAMIVGGALRDTFNDRAVKDVDIFVKAPMFGNRKKMLTKIFGACGFKIQMEYYDDYSGRSISYASLQPLNKIRNAYDREKSAFGRIDAWRVVAGPQATEYNIVFVNSPLADDLRHQANPKKVHPDKPASIFNFINKPAIKEFMQKIDIGLCQITYNGQKIFTTDAYEQDVKEKTITLVNPANSYLYHIERVCLKYPDFKQCAATQEVLRTRRLPTAPARPDGQYLTNYIAVRAYM